MVTHGMEQLKAFQRPHERDDTGKQRTEDVLWHEHLLTKTRSSVQWRDAET